MINKFFSKLPTFSLINYPKRIMGVDIGTNSIKLAEGVFVNDSIAISQVHIEVLPHNIDEALSAEALSEYLIHAQQISGMRAKLAITALPYNKLFMQKMILPIIDYQELQEAINWEITRINPFSQGYYYDFIIIKQEQTSSEIMIFIADKVYVDYLVDAFHQASLEIIAIESQPFSLGRFVNCCGSYIIVNLGKSAAIVTIYNKQLPLSSEIIKLGGDNFTNILKRILNLSYQAAEKLKGEQLINWAENADEDQILEITENLFNLEKQLSCEIIRIYEYYKIQNRHDNIEQIFLCGGAALLTGLLNTLQNELPLPIRLLNEQLPIKCTEALDAASILIKLPQMAAAIGMVMRGK